MRSMTRTWESILRACRRDLNINATMAKFVIQWHSINTLKCISFVDDNNSTDVIVNANGKVVVDMRKL